MKSNYNFAGLVACVCLGWLLSACGGRSYESLAWVGTNISIGIVWVHDQSVPDSVAFVCDGDNIREWFTRLEIKGDPEHSYALDETNPEGAHLRFQLIPIGLTVQASGSFTSVGGQAYPFLANRASGNAGIYRSEETIDGEKWVGGWILGNDGQVCGALVSPSGEIRNRNALSKSAILVTSSSQITDRKLK